MEIDINGVRFTCLGTTDHTRVDGKQTLLYVWQGHCTHPGCAKTWEFKAPALNREGQQVDPGHPSRHYFKPFRYTTCLEHYVRPPTKPGAYTSRQKVTDEDVQQMHEAAKKHTGSRSSLYEALSVYYGLTPNTVREILSGRRR